MRHAAIPLAAATDRLAGAGYARGALLRRMSVALLVALAGVAVAEDQFTATSAYVRERVPAKESIVCPLVEHVPKLDGTLEDPLWRQACAHTESAFTQLGRLEHVDRQTMVYFCRDATRLYVCFDCEEPEIEQQDVDARDIASGDHIGLRIEQGDIRGRGPRMSLIGNRAGMQPLDGWQPQGIEYVCKAGPKRWMAQLAIPFAATPLARPPVRGEVWGLKLVRYGKGSGPGRLRSSWPAIPVISEDVVLHNGRLFFETDELLANGALACDGGAPRGWTVVSGTPSTRDGALACAQPVTISQTVKLVPGMRCSLDWDKLGWDGSARALAGATELVRAPLAAEHLDLTAPKDGDGAVTIELTLSGSGAARFALSSLVDDVPDGYVCLTDNDWVRARDRAVRLPGTSPGAYTYLKSPQQELGRAPYRSVGCPEPTGEGELPWDWKGVGRPTRPPLDAPPARPDIGDDEVECFPVETLFADAGLPDRVGLPLGSWDVGGTSGWIPFPRGSLTGDPSWAGWPSDRWGGAVGHDLVFAFDQPYFVRRVDILCIKSTFRNLEISVRSGEGAESPFALVYRRYGPGTGAEVPDATLPALMSVRDLDSMARQVRLSLGVTTPGGMNVAGAPADLFGVAEVWIWGEAADGRSVDLVKHFKPVVPAAAPPRTAHQLQRLDRPVIWPRPKRLAPGEGRFALDADVVVAAAGGGQVATVAGALREEIAYRVLASPALVSLEQVAGRRAILLGVHGVDDRFDALCAGRGLEAPAAEQGYVLQVAPDAVLIAGSDLDGLRHGARALAQWLEHDERVGFARCVRVDDWPRLSYRTILPSPDHRKSLMPTASSPATFRAIIGGLAQLGFNAVEDFAPLDAGYPGDTGALVRWADDHGVELRPVLAGSITAWPGDCVEADPDAQPDHDTGIGSDDGTWEVENLCPSNPATYARIDALLDRLAVTRPTARCIDLALMGSRLGAWNVCARCRGRHLADGPLYAEFINRIGRACTAHGLTPVITNAMLLGDPRRAPAFDLINRATVLRLDRNMARPQVVIGGFWGLSRPTTPPPALGPSDAWDGGPTFYAPLPPNRAAEGILQIGEATTWWWWVGPLTRRALPVADEFWNGPAPDRASEPAEVCDRVEQEAAKAAVRWHERWTRGCEYPSWRTGMRPEFFSVDLRKLCTRSHVDDGVVSGLGRSGPREGLIALGPQFDFRRLPLGRGEFAGVPFEIIDPETNAWRSMVVVADAPRSALLPGSVTRVEIPIGRTAASLCVLRTALRANRLLTDGSAYRHLVWPAYSLLYADGTRHVCDREIVREYDWLDSQVFFYSNIPDTAGNVGPCGTSPNLLWNARCAWMTSSLAGKRIDLYLNEFVNPYPEKPVRALVVELPNPEQRELTKAFHEAIFAVTGVAPTAWDERWWRARPRAPLLLPEPDRPADAAVVADAALEQRAEGPTLVLSAERRLCAVEFRLGTPWTTFSATTAIGFAHRDCTVQVSHDGREWSDVGRIAGCTGMDGTHRVVFPPTAVRAVRLVIDGSAYPDEDPIEVNLLSLTGLAR